MDTASISNACSTPGDSGGPVLINNQLVGINQYVKADDNNPDSSEGDRSGHIKISSIRSWINKHINN
jgi:V8-like Glu-specific endopeptidase